MNEQTSETKVIQELLSLKNFQFMSNDGHAVVRVRDFDVIDSHGNFQQLDTLKPNVAYLNGYIQSSGQNGPTFKINKLPITGW